MIKRFGDAPLRGQVYTRRPGAYAILRDGDSLLLTHQRQPYPEFQLPGGGIDPGEHPIAALHREVWEETGWRMSPPHRLGCFRRFTFMPEYEIWAEKVCTVYLAHPVRRLGNPTEPHHSALWMSIPDAVQQLGNAGDSHFVAQLLR